MSYDPILKVFKKDYEKVDRSNWQLNNKNRLSMDFGYLYPVAIYDVLPNTYFKLDMNAVLSSNPTIAPMLGSAKLRAEAYFIEKAAYAPKLRQNQRLPVERNVPWPVTNSYRSPQYGLTSNQPIYFSPATGLLEHLNMYPADWRSSDWNTITSGATTSSLDDFPSLNGIPLLMYYDIFRNYYLNVQDDNVPLRTYGFDPSSSTLGQIEDTYITRENLDSFIEDSISGGKVDEAYYDSFGVSMLPSVYRPTNTTSWQSDPINHFAFSHYGLLRRTYNNDFFTSYISNENVTLMKSGTSIDTRSGSITVEQISVANRNWRFRMRSLLWGTDWSDYNRVHFGTRVITRYGKPQFLGSLSSDIIFNDIISQSQSGSNLTNTLDSNTNLGSRAGLAFGNVTNKTRDPKDYKPFVEFTTEEEGFVMVLLSLVPEVNYFQGVDPMYFKTNLNQSYSPEYNAIGMQDFFKAWCSVILNRDFAGMTYTRWREWNTAIHKVPMWFEYMARYNQLHGYFTLDNVYKYWTFTRPFTNLGEYFKSLSSDSYGFYDSTYVLPELHNYMFANPIGYDNFQCSIKFDCFQKQLLDKQIIAYL